MAINETLFPLTLSRLNARPVWNTTIVVGSGGHESRNANWQDVLYKYNAGFSIKTYADIDTLASFFNVVKGRETAFLIKDQMDFQVSSWTEFGETITGASQTFQLFRRYSDALSNTYDRNITKVDGSQVEIQTDPGSVALTYDASPPPTAETHFSVDDATGLVTIDPAASVTNIYFKVPLFYIPVRFDTDELPIDLLNYWIASSTDTGNVQIPDIPLMETRI